ncbi:MAG: DedA family protein [Candidatus Dormibacteraceae bacterium]
MTASLIHLVETGGLVAIFLGMILESCGIPVSVEVVAPVGGALAAQGKLPLAGIVAAIVAGNLIGSFIAYGLARRYGRQLILGPGRYIGLSDGHLVLADRFFNRFGAWAVLIGRVLPVICGYISFPAGLARMRPAVFGIMTLVGSSVWAIFLTVIGYKLGEHWRQLANALGALTIPFVLILAALVVIAYLLGRRWVHQRTSAPAEID